MILLFDQNISHRAVHKLSDHFPGIKHVKDFDLEFAKDREIWGFARKNNFAIVTLDADFSDLATLYGLPPKIIWIRFGNTLTQHFVDKFLQRKELIISFLSDEHMSEIACLEIDS